MKALAERHYSYDMSDAEIEAHWGKSFTTLFASLFGALDGDTPRVIERYLALLQDFPIEAYPGAVEAVIALSQRCFVGIVTSAHSRVVVADLTRLSFPVGEIRHIQCAEDTTCHKPDPLVFEPLLKALEKSGIKPAEVVYVGDAITDFSAASAAGIPFVGYRGGPNRENPFAALPIRVVSDLRELVG
jgi:HAD superfamily hydrolase (TIGR01549 family)